MLEWSHERKTVSKFCSWFLNGRPVMTPIVMRPDRQSTTREIAGKLNVSHKCIRKKIKQPGFVKKFDLWIPYQLKEIHLTKRISIWDWLLKQLMTGDEKWIVYDNKIVMQGVMQYYARWTNTDETKKLRFTNKSLCCQFGKIIKEFCTLNFDQEAKRLILQQLVKLNDSVEESLIIRQKLLKLGWDVTTSTILHWLRLPFLSFHAELFKMVKCLMIQYLKTYSN